MASTVSIASAAAADNDGDETLVSPAETLDLILSCHLPFLLSVALSTRTLVGRCRLLHSKLSLLLSALTNAAGSPKWPSNQLFRDHLLPALLATLRNLRSLSALYLDQDLRGGNSAYKATSPPPRSRSTSTISTFYSALACSATTLPLRRLPMAPRRLFFRYRLPPLPAPSASVPCLALFVRDVFAHLQISALDLKGKALDSLLELLASGSIYSAGRRSLRHWPLPPPCLQNPRNIAKITKGEP